MTLHVVLWLWRGWRPVYDRRDVAYIARQLQAYGDLPAKARIVCLTDFPTDWQKAKCDALGVVEIPLWPELEGLDIRPIPQYPWLPAFKHAPNCYKRLRIFDPETQGHLGIHPGDIVLSMDLDSVVMGSIQKLLAPMYNHVGGVDFMAMEGKAARLHGSLFAFRAGTNAHVWRTFDPATSPWKLRHPPHGAARYIGSDQAWLSTVLPMETPVWGAKDGVYAWSRHFAHLRPRDPVTYMSFAGSTKPRGESCKLHLPWVYAHAMNHWEE